MTRLVGRVAAWLLLAVVIGSALFLTSHRSIVLASHDAVLRPDLSGRVELNTGPVLPDLRTNAGGRIGVRVDLGKTEARTADELIQRYAVIAAGPDGQVAKIHQAVRDMAVAAAIRGAAFAVIPMVLWWAIGAERRRELARRARSRRGLLALLVLVVLVVAVWQPWRPWQSDEPTGADRGEWTPLADYLGSAVPLPDELGDVEIRIDVTTEQTRRLVESMVDTFDRSRSFYDDAAAAAADIDVRAPEEGETVVALVSDRHDNIGMDRVARAIADRAGAEVVFDAGDDTSVGRSWEAFSLDSVSEAFDGFEKYAVTGNHDNGDFVGDYLSEQGWTVLEGEIVEGPGGTSVLGVGDPRASGLGNWRDETGLSFAEVRDRITETACAQEQKVTTILVHDASLGRGALEQGCAELVVGGHLHVTRGPDPVLAPDGSLGHSFTTGTTGGAAYAIALGSTPRRQADVSLLTYADGHATGVQTVSVAVDGRLDVGEWQPLRSE